MNKMKKKINLWACYNRIWSWSLMPCEKHGPRASVTTKTSAFGLGFCLLSPSGHVFHTAWETMIKSYNRILFNMVWLNINLVRLWLGDTKTCSIKPTAHQPISHNAPFCNRNVHMCAHFFYKIMHCGIFVTCIVGFVRWVHWNQWYYW